MIRKRFSCVVSIDHVVYLATMWSGGERERGGERTVRRRMTVLDCQKTMFTAVKCSPDCLLWRLLATMHCSCLFQTPHPLFLSSGVFINNSSMISLWMWRICLGLRKIRLAFVPLCSASAQCVCSFYPPVYLSVPGSVSGCSCASGQQSQQQPSNFSFLLHNPRATCHRHAQPMQPCSLQLAACLCRLIMEMHSQGPWSKERWGRGRERGGGIVRELVMASFVNGIERTKSCISWIRDRFSLSPSLFLFLSLSN